VGILLGRSDIVSSGQFKSGLVVGVLLILGIVAIMSIIMCVIGAFLELEKDKHKKSSAGVINDH